jgi:hypothetical protein
MKMLSLQSLHHRDWWCGGSFRAMNEDSKIHSTLYLLWNPRPIELIKKSLRISIFFALRRDFSISCMNMKKKI